MIKTIHAVNDEDIKKVDTTITETNGNNTKKHAFWDTQVRSYVTILFVFVLVGVFG